MPLGGVGVPYFEHKSTQQCAWPLEPWEALPVAQRRFCGQPLAPGKDGKPPPSYCPGHIDVAYRRPRPGGDGA